MRSSNSPAEIGSRPEVGSSRNNTPGSSASARASAARLIMPPESSEGNLSAASGGRPTSRSFSIASSARSAGEMSRCSRIGASTFCRTVRLENSAPCWNSTPQPRSTRPRSGRLSAVEIAPVDLDDAGLLGLQAEDRARQHRLAGARGADEAQHLAAPDVEIEPVHHLARAEGDFETAHADRRGAISVKTAPPRKTSRRRRRAG